MNSNRDRALAVRGMQALARIEDHNGGMIAPAVSIYETEEAFLVSADMPGADKDSVKVRSEAGLLIIRAAVAPDHVRSAQHSNRMYTRKFVLTDGIDYGKASAEFADGVLTVRLPKTVEAQHRDIPVRGD